MLDTSDLLHNVELVVCKLLHVTAGRCREEGRLDRWRCCEGDVWSLL
jgi:hypothetical protein